MDQIGHHKWEAEMAYTKMVMVCAACILFDIEDVLS